MDKGEVLQSLLCIQDLVDLVRARNGVLMQDDLDVISIIIGETRVFIAENVKEESKDYPSLRDLGFIK